MRSRCTSISVEPDRIVEAARNVPDAGVGVWIGITTDYLQIRPAKTMTRRRADNGRLGV